MPTISGTHLAQIFVSAFLAILFLQSGLDKIIDRRGNREWLTSHFAKSPLAGMVPMLFLVITMVELAAGLFSAAGCLIILFYGGTLLAFYGAILSALAIVCLFFGQRMAKEYAGAAVLVPYFLVSLAGLYLLQ
jgi:hypothetical protein